MSLNNPLTALLETQPFIVLDGAMATELEARGCNPVSYTHLTLPTIYSV